jgi:hypothetical protein
MSPKRLLHIRETPLLPPLSLAQGHHKVLPPCLLLIRSALSLRPFLLFPHRCARFVWFRLAVFGKSQTILFRGCLVKTACGPSNIYGRRDEV